jgi:hypothetical protein
MTLASFRLHIILLPAHPPTVQRQSNGCTRRAQSTPSSSTMSTACETVKCLQSCRVPRAAPPSRYRYSRDISVRQIPSWSHWLTKKPSLDVTSFARGRMALFRRTSLSLPEHHPIGHVSSAFQRLGALETWDIASDSNQNPFDVRVSTGW